jgi:predicted DNA-binding WGR domain protein
VAGAELDPIRRREAELRSLVGWIASRGRELADVFETEEQAAKALEALATAKRRRGYLDL